MRLRPRSALLVILALAAALLVACGGSSKSSSGSSSSSGSTTNAVNIANSGGKVCPYHFALITHGDNGSFWSVVYKGAQNAASDLGCTLTEKYGSQQQGQAQPDDNAENAQITNAINAHVDGIAVSDHDPTLMNPTIKSAVAAGIPVVLLNAGCDNTDIAASGAMTCVGQPEQLAGVASGQRFAKLGATNVLCNGLAQGLGVGSTCKSGSPPSKGPGCTELTLSTPNAASNPQQAIGQVTSYLQAHPEINAVMTLNNAIATALVSAHPANNPKVATFDLNSGVQTDLQNGTLAFAVDQQQFLQGYLPIEFLYLYKKHEGNTTGGGTTVASGPLLVDKSNVSKVAAAIAAGDD
jgi:simple sugar transport system substrate-binding protein